MEALKAWLATQVSIFLGFDSPDIVGYVAALDEDAAVELAEQIACNGPLALAATKQILEARRDWTNLIEYNRQDVLGMMHVVGYVRAAKKLTS